MQALVTQATPDEPEKSSWWSFFCCCSSKAPQRSNDNYVSHDIGLQDRNSQIPCLLPPLGANKLPTLVLDLDETLVHSSFKPIHNPDFIIDIELDGTINKVYVRKRPGVDEYLKEVGKKWEVIIFTASLSKYADPLLDVLDSGGVISARLYRESCVLHFGAYVKDLTHLNRPMESCVIVDNSPMSYMFQPDHAIPCTTWTDDPSDRELPAMLGFLDKLLEVDDMSDVCRTREFPFLGANSDNFP